MTEPTPDPAPRPDAESDLEPNVAVMPGWVPILIGALLVVIAALAVFTGLRFRRGGTLEQIVGPTDAGNRRDQAPAPSGEPEAGASLVMPGHEGGAVPQANAPVSGSSRAVVTGGPGGVSSSVRIWARRGVVFNVLPEDTMVYVNGLPIGHVTQFNSMDEVYDFPAAGSYTVRLVSPGHRDREFIITAAEDAKQDIARVSVKLAAE